MVTPPGAVYDVVNHGSLGWRIRLNDEDEPRYFPNREGCVAEAAARARHQHALTGQPTEVWAPGYDGVRQCVVRYMKPSDLDELLRRGTSHFQLLGVSYADGPLFLNAQG
ncbi:hypothetical protein GLE_0043 [Lysobacter enzymogenes]|uniref:Uncharacterized protein n=1 Tax=Lysobacter enzymogenes TaxID=69 RepID=A0A0S2DA34_LYSEN|nr:MULTISPECIES: hypothetical protein [Lysobacter]ALN55402.1 hypothetical protein GLE_0043 [Lysobacter enzymogenes]QCW24487.1 hypothetical protein FE772_01145 [Lysobacter enzymogenes]SDZ19784.1 hypothetical protein SAMN04487939_1229 [Lysobacter sp. yr284]